jgi:hypothetical protein
MCEWVPFELNNRLATAEGTVHGAIVETQMTRHTQKCYRTTSNSVQQKSSGLLICAFIAFLCLPFISINHAAYILTENTHMFA